jgi:hypothetical protein
MSTINDLKTFRVICELPMANANLATDRLRISSDPSGSNVMMLIDDKQALVDADALIAAVRRCKDARGV